MVNSRLRNASIDGRGSPDDRSSAIFATKAALTIQVFEVGAFRSRFGPGDSWVIKKLGGNYCREELRDWANLGLCSPSVVSIVIRVRRDRGPKETLFAGD
jgi:hypothetical protein